MVENSDLRPMEHWTDDAIAFNDTKMLRLIKAKGIPLGELGTVWVFNDEGGCEVNLIEDAGSDVTDAVDWIVRRGFGEVIDGGRRGRQALRLYEPISYLLQSVSMS